MKIKVRTLQNNEEEIAVENEDTIMDVKKKVQIAMPEMESDKQKLIFSGRILKDEDKAVDILKENDTVIVMITRKHIFKSNAAKENQNNKEAPKTEIISETKNTESNTVENAQKENVTNPESMMVTGDQLKETIDNLCNIGFNKENVERAMRLAYNNPNRAFDFLTNGFPPTLNESDNANPYSNSTANAGSQLTEDMIEDLGAGANVSELLRNSNFLNALRDVTASNPQRIPELLEMIERVDPSLLEAIRENQGEFMRVIQNLGNTDLEQSENTENVEALDDEEPLGESFMEPTEEQINETLDTTNNYAVSILNESEMESVKKLEALGFSKHAALEAFIACDKNEEMAANYLFENMDEFNAE